MTAFLFSCTHATCAVPEAYREVFRGAEDVVMSVEGWEPGALNLAQGFSMRFRTPLVHGDVTRLLIDLEREGDERWSRFSMKLPEATRVKVADRHEKPFRASLRQRIDEDLRRWPAVVHVMVHTDAATDGRVTLETPPDAPLAETVAGAWRQRLATGDLDASHFRNCVVPPLVAELARQYPADRYAQVRLGVSQSFFLEGRPWRWEPLKKHLLVTLEQAVADSGPFSDPECSGTDPS